MGRHDHDDELQAPELAAFVEGLRTAFPARPSASEDLHVAAMVETAHLLADKGDPVVRPASNADAPANAQVSWLPKQRRNGMTERNLTRTLVTKVLAPVTVVFTVMGGLAYAGALPDPLQKVASDAAGLVGLSIDDGTQGDTTEAPDTTDTEAPEPTDAPSDVSGDQTGEDNQGEDTQDATTEDDQGEDTQGDTQGEDTQDSTTEDNQGDTTDSQDSTSSDDNQGDTTDSTSNDSQGDSSGDSGDGGSGSGDNQD
jgi:hypothetical protein